MNLPVDPKKLAPGALDSHHLEEAPGGVRLLVEMVSGLGRSPDEVAWELQRRDFLGEIGLLTPFLALSLLASMGIRFSEAWIMPYVFAIWPALGFRLVWAPLRGRSPRGFLANLQDLFFLGVGFLQSLMLAVPAAAAAAMVGFHLFDSTLNLGRAAQSGFFAASWLMVLPFVSARVLAASLVERELEEEVAAALPAGEEEDLAPRSLAASHLRTLFRSSLWFLAGASPMFLWTWVLGMGYGFAPWLFKASVWAGGLLGIQHLFRGFFYAAMASATRRRLERSRQEHAGAPPGLPGEDRPPPGEGAAPSCPGESSSEHSPREASLRTLSRRDATWRRLRSPGELLVHGAVSVTALGAVALVHASLGPLASLPMVLVTLAPWAARKALPDAPPSLGSVARATLPCALVLSGVLAALQAYGPPFLEGLGRSPVAPLLTVLTVLVVVEGTARAWAWSLARLLPQAPRGPWIPWGPRSLDATGETWRRSLLVSVGTWAMGVALLTVLGWMGIHFWRLGIRWMDGVVLMLLPLFMGAQVMLQSHLAEAVSLAEARGGARGSLPESGGETPGRLEDAGRALPEETLPSPEPSASGEEVRVLSGDPPGSSS